MRPWQTIANASPDQMRALQNTKLHSFLNHYLYPFSPFYRRLLDQHKVDPQRIRCVEDLRRIPFTSKSDLVDEQNPQHFKDFILQPTPELIRRHWPPSRLFALKAMGLLRGREKVKDILTREFRPIFMTFTTGTTGKPVPFVYTRLDMDHLHDSGTRLFQVLNVDPAEYVVNMFPYAPHLAFWQVVAAGFSSYALILSTGGGKVMGTSGNIAALERMRPSVIIGVPGYLYHVLRCAREQGRRMEYVRKVILGASRVTPAFKRKLQELLAELGSRDVTVLGTYGFTEARMAWGECPAGEASSGYHLYPDREIFEVIDPRTGEPRRPGEDGEIVYTSLGGRGSCILRYRTGDFVKGGITWDPCPHCGRTVPRLSSDITRLSDVRDVQVSKIKGVLVNLNAFAAVFAGMDLIEEWQIELRKKNNDPFEMDEVCVYISTSRKCDETILRDDLRQQILAATEITPNDVVVIPLAEMIRRIELETANKEKRIIDRRPEC